MLTALSILSLAQIATTTPSTPVPRSATPAITSPAPIPIPHRQAEIIRHQNVLPLPGQLDNVPVFNSNSPELVQADGILLSTFPPDGMRVPSAHLDYALNGRFDIFAHHVARGLTPNDTRTLFVGVVIYNPGTEPVTVDVLQGVSYLSQDAPFLDLPSYVANPQGVVYAGPGSRTVTEVLRGERQSQWPAQLVIPPKQAQLLMNVPIPLRRLTVPADGSLPPGYIIPAPVEMAVPTPPAVTGATLVSTLAAPIRPAPPPPDDRPLPTNGRSALMRLSSNGPVYVASLAMFAPKVANGTERVPNLSEWLNLLVSAGLSGPRDRPPSRPESPDYVRFYYGRVSGVSQGSQWTATATDSPGVDHLSIPQPGQTVSYVISTVDRNTFGTDQVQSAPMIVRYPDTAYRAHGNYGVLYDVSLPLYNNTDRAQSVAIMMQTPVQDERLQDGLKFRQPPDDQIFFRGTVRLRYTNDFGLPQTRYIHLVQRRGQEGEPLLRLNLQAGDRRMVEVQFIYPPDATPPQVLTVQTLGAPQVIEARNQRIENPAQ